MIHVPSLETSGAQFASTCQNTICIILTLIFLRSTIYLLVFMMTNVIKYIYETLIIQYIFYKTYCLFTHLAMLVYGRLYPRISIIYLFSLI